MKNILSIVIPIYNAEKYIHRCLESILNQNLDKCEIILVDDGSIDSSLQICYKYAEKYNNIKVYHKDNGGASSARNYGLKKANGEYIWFIDCDDSIEKESIAKLISCMNLKKSDVIVCQSKKVELNGEIIDECEYSIEKGEYSSEQFMKVMKKSPNSVIFCPQYYIVKRDFIKKNAIYFYEGIIYEDELWIPQLLIKADKIYYTALNIYYHYMVSSSVMHTTKLDKMRI